MKPNKNNNLISFLVVIAFIICTTVMFVSYRASSIIVRDRNEEDHQKKSTKVFSKPPKLISNSDGRISSSSSSSPRLDKPKIPFVFASPVTLTEFDQHHHKGLNNINKERVVLFNTDSDGRGEEDDNNVETSFLTKNISSVSSSRRSIRFFAIGDWGGPGRKPQRDVAALMAKIANVENWKEKFIKKSNNNNNIHNNHDEKEDHADNEADDGNDEEEEQNGEANVDDTNHEDRKLLFDDNDNHQHLEQEDEDERKALMHNNNNHHHQNTKHHQHHEDGPAAEQEEHFDHHNHHPKKNHHEKNLKKKKDTKIIYDATNSNQQDRRFASSFLKSFPSVAARPGSPHLDFIVGCGDNIYESGANDEFDPRFKRNFEHVYTDPSISHKLWFQSIGNHDVSSHSIFRDISGQIRYTLKSPNKRWWMPATYYAHDYFLGDDGDDNPLLFIAFLHTYDVSGHLTKMSKSQIKWLEWRLSRTRAKWRFVVGHRPIFSSGKKHGSSKYMQNLLMPLFDKYNVTAYFSGDDHQIQMLKKEKTTFVVSGGGARLEPMKKTGVAETIYQRKEFGFVSVEVNQDEVRMAVHHTSSSSGEGSEEELSSFVHEII